VEKIPVNMKRANIWRLLYYIISDGSAQSNGYMHSHVLDEFIGATDIPELTEANLGDNSTKLATGSRDTVGS